MRLHFCPLCNQATPGPALTSAVVQAIDDDGDTCAHVPQCLGPWTHAVRVVREAWQRGEQQRVAATVAANRVQS